MDLSIFVVVAGWIGAVCTVLAYGLLSSGRLRPESIFFQVANIIGAALLFVSASANGAWPSAIVNIIWILIGAQALFGLIRALRLRRGTAAADLAPEYVELAPTLIMPVITAQMIEDAAHERSTEHSVDTGRLILA